MGFTFLAFAERERLQARRCKETTPERDSRLDDQRDRAQARRRRETTPERDARLDDLREELKPGGAERPLLRERCKLECHARKCLSPPPSLKRRILVYQETPSHKVVVLYFSPSKLQRCHKQHVVVARSAHAQCL